MNNYVCIELFYDIVTPTKQKCRYFIIPPIFCCVNLIRKRQFGMFIINIFNKRTHAQTHLIIIFSIINSTCLYLKFPYHRRVSDS